MILRADTYLYDTDEASRESGLACEDVSRAQQSFAAEVDINTIVKRFGLTGQLPESVRVPLPEDFYDILDFHSAMNVVRQGEEAFAQMPAAVRARFSNDPGEFLDFVNNPENTEEAIRLGIANRRVEVSEEPVVAPPPVPPAG